MLSLRSLWRGWVDVRRRGHLERQGLAAKMPRLGVGDLTRPGGILIRFLALAVEEMSVEKAASLVLWE